MEKAKSEVRTCEQGEKWPLSQVCRCLDTINTETFGMEWVISFHSLVYGISDPLVQALLGFVFVVLFFFPQIESQGLTVHGMLSFYLCLRKKADIMKRMSSNKYYSSCISPAKNKSHQSQIFNKVNHLVPLPLHPKYTSSCSTLINC